MHAHDGPSPEPGSKDVKLEAKRDSEPAAARPSGALLALQRQAGNRAVSGAVGAGPRAKATPGDVPAILRITKPGGGEVLQRVEVTGVATGETLYNQQNAS